MDSMHKVDKGFIISVFSLLGFCCGRREELKALGCWKFCQRRGILKYVPCKGGLDECTQPVLDLREPP